MDLIDDTPHGENAHEFTVSEISGAVKRVIEGEFGRVRVRGEVGQVFRARTGHLYFQIKDDRNVLKSVSWKGQVSALEVVPEEGMEVIATGKLTTFGSQSQYQLNVDSLVMAGEGALMAMLEKRKKQLAAEGLFDPARKRPLPMLPDVIGVVTSPTGAVIRDILHRLRERFPRKVLVWPVAVQGQACAGEVARAIEGFNALTPGGPVPRPDLLIVARGGGSIEDLWGFNEEIVARAAAASDIPLISAVGHETDTTLIDYVSDQRAPTPTAAAEFAVPVRLDLMAWSDDQGSRMSRAMAQAMQTRSQRLRDLARGMPRPADLTAEPRQRLDLAEARRPAALQRSVARLRQQLTERAGALRPTLLQARQSAARQAVTTAQQGLARGLQHGVAQQRARYDRHADRLDPRLAQGQITQARDRVGQLGERLDHLLERYVSNARQNVDTLDKMRVSLGPNETLRRGYAVVRSGDQVVTTAKAAKGAPDLSLQFADGTVTLGAQPARKPKAKPAPPEQGDLF